MGRYIARRIVAALPVMLIVATAVFFLLRLIPGDPATMMLGPNATSREIDQLRVQLGLTRPVWVQLILWYGGLVHGDLGRSIFLGAPVTEVVLNHLPPTLYLTLLASAIGITLGLGTALAAVIRPGRTVDQLMTFFAVLGMSMPEFLWGLVMILVFAVTFRWFPVAGYVPPETGAWSFLRYMALPAASLGIFQAALITRVTRASMLETLGQDYVRTARAKGLGTAGIFLRHVLRPSLIPTVTIVGVSFAVLMAGAIVIETIFTIPGIGQLVINAVRRRDYPLVQGDILIIAGVYVVINTLVDISYAVLDPRIRYT